MERVEADLHDVAARNVSLIVSACRFGCVPADFGFLFHTRAWRPTQDDRRQRWLLGVSRARAGRRRQAAGTAQVTAQATEAQCESLTVQITSDQIINNFSLHLKLLIDAQIPGGHPPPKGSLLERDNPLGIWAMTMKLPSADTMVVNRTLSTITKHPEGLPGAEESLEFTEHRKNFWSLAKPAHFGVRISSLKVIVPFLFTGFLIRLFGNFIFGQSILLKFPKLFTLELFRKNRPTEAEVENSCLEMWFVGRGFSDAARASKHECKTDKQIITKVSGSAGYMATRIILVQCALVLLSLREKLPKGGSDRPALFLDLPIFRGASKRTGCRLMF
ncbi:hypothetical protein EJB05_06110, partial [Eragrostis curvula]